ncbi:hypothetical protein YC2023_111907 [Brassica napus]
MPISSDLNNSRNFMTHDRARRAASNLNRDGEKKPERDLGLYNPGVVSHNEVLEMY